MKGLLIITLFSVAYAAPGGKCPETPSEQPVFLPNLADCTTYYQCSGSTPILEHCPPGLEWAQNLGRCDWPEVAKCSETETEEPQITTEPGIVPTGTTVPYPTECPPKDGPTDVLLKNPKDCHSFFKCLKGQAYLVQCPPGQEWADHLKRCDWPEVADCKVES